MAMSTFAGRRTEFAVLRALTCSTHSRTDGQAGNISNVCTACCRTMYCVRGNYEFGISRVMDSLRPYDQKLGALTWYYAKRCLLALVENLAKHLFTMRDSVRLSCLRFLEDCESTS